MFRRKGHAFEVLLVHPGGPLFAKKDEGAWTIPKGEATPEEDLLTRAQIEFEEELAIKPSARGIFHRGGCGAKNKSCAGRVAGSTARRARSRQFGFETRKIVTLDRATTFSLCFTSVRARG